MTLSKQDATTVNITFTGGGWEQLKPPLYDNEAIVDVFLARYDRLYLKTTRGWRLLSKDVGETWTSRRGPLPKSVINRDNAG